MKLAALRAVERITHPQLHRLGGLRMSLGLVRRLHRGVERRRLRRGLGVLSPPESLKSGLLELEFGFEFES